MNKVSKMNIKESETAAPISQDRIAQMQLALSEEDRSKDAFFGQLAGLAEAMIAAHGKDFAIGTLVLAAKFIAEGKPLVTKHNSSAAT